MDNTDENDLQEANNVEVKAPEEEQGEAVSEVPHQQAVEEEEEETSGPADEPSIAAEPSDEELAAMAESPVSESAKGSKWFKSKKLWIIVLVLAALAAGAYFMFMGKDSTDMASDLPLEQTNQNEVQRFGVAVGLIEGAAEYSKDGTEWVKLTSETDLSEGHFVRTAKGARLVLLIDDGSAVRLNGDSEINFKSLATDDVRIDNLRGEVYSRVVASETRRYAVYADGDLYQAMGTAYRTLSTEETTGVEVYESDVKIYKKMVDDEDGIDVKEGNAYYTKSEDKKENEEIELDIDELKDDDFVKWCAEQDEKEDEFKDEMGILDEVIGEEEKEEEPKEEPKKEADGITLKATALDYYVSLSWTVKDVNVKDGYKLLRSKDDSTPDFPDDKVAFIDGDKTSYKFETDDGGTYYYRLCTFHPDETCDNFSNAVKATTKEKPETEVENGTITLSKSGSLLSWDDTGSGPQGYKVYFDTDPGAGAGAGDHVYKKFTYDLSLNLSNLNDLVDGTLYYIRVCRIKDGSCYGNYSNEKTYTP